MSSGQEMPASLNVRQTTLNWILFGLLFAALIGTGLALKIQLTAQGWAGHTLAVKTSLMEMLSTLRDAETGQRGFALSGDASFLEPFNAAQQKMDLRLQDLERSVSDNPVQIEKLDRLRSIATAQLAALRDTIQRVDGKVSAAFTVEDLHRSLRANKQRMDEARGAISRGG